VDRLASVGLVTTCNPGGAGKWQADFKAFFRGREVVIIPDNDDTGRSYRQGNPSAKVAIALIRG
jgi:putative DNA primase/helicase